MVEDRRAAQCGVLTRMQVSGWRRDRLCGAIQQLNSLNHYAAIYGESVRVMSTSARHLPPVLPGEGAGDYVRYMRTDALLSLQKTSEERAHRDELLFQTVHQTTELWLKHACFEVDGAVADIEAGNPGNAILLLRRGCLAMEFVTDALRMLTYMTPADFQKVAAELGNGSGLESPGWRDVRAVSPRLGAAFDKLLAADGRDLLQLYHSNPADPLYQLAEALISWDDAVNLWRVRHYGIALRIRGARAFGTGGNPVEMLNKLIHRKFFPELWEVREAIASGES